MRPPIKGFIQPSVSWEVVFLNGMMEELSKGLQKIFIPRSNA
jgi:hypothetical protein